MTTPPKSSDLMEEYARLVRACKLAEVRAETARQQAALAQAQMQEFWRACRLPNGAYLVEGGTHVVLVGGGDYPPLVAVALIEQPPTE